MFLNVAPSHLSLYRFKKHAGGYAPFKKGDYENVKETALDPTEWYEIRPSWE